MVRRARMHAQTLSLQSNKHRAESNRQVQSWFSESDVSDINESDSRPASPVTVLEAVDGVQPELQHTSKESELVSKSSKTKTKTKIKPQHFFLISQKKIQNKFNIFFFSVISHRTT